MYIPCSSKKDCVATAASGCLAVNIKVLSLTRIYSLPSSNIPCKWGSLISLAVIFVPYVSPNSLNLLKNGPLLPPLIVA